MRNSLMSNYWRNGALFDAAWPVSDGDRAIGAHPSHRRPCRLRMALVVAVVAGLCLSAAYVSEQTRRFFAITLRVSPGSIWPVVPPLACLVDHGGWPRHCRAVEATAEELATNAPLWQRMHLADWNGIPRAVREPGLDAMLARYGNVLMDPSAWDTMTPEDWDDIPQPIRTVASRSHSRSNAHQ